MNLRSLPAALALGLGVSAAGCDDAAVRKSDQGDAVSAACLDPSVCGAECLLDRDCPVGDRCRDGLCESPGPEADMAVDEHCTRNGDCPAGFACDGATRLCVIMTTPDRACDDSRDCFAREICLEDYCRPAPDAAAPDAADPDALVLTLDAALADALAVDAFRLPADAALLDAALVDAALADALALDAANPDALVLPMDSAFPDGQPVDLGLVVADAALSPDAAPPPPDGAVLTPDAAVVTPDAATPLPDAAPPLPDAAPPPPDVAPPLPDLAIGPPPTPGRGVFDFGRIPLGGAEELRAVDFHPDASYAVILQRTNVIHVLDWETQSAMRYDLRPGPNINIYWDDVAFDPRGGFAYAVGTRISGNAREGVIYRFDDAVYRDRAVNMQVPAVEVQRVAGQEFSGIEYPPESYLDFHDGHPVVLAKSGASGPNAFLRDLDPETNAFGALIIAQPLGYGAEDLAFVNNEFGDPGILVVGGTNGAGFFYYTEIAGIGEVRVNPGSNNVGNLFSVSAHPPGDYALTLNGGNAHLRRFEGALMNQSADGPWFQRQNISNVRFQQEGQRALIYGGAFGNPMAAYVFEYRHDLYDCPAPFADCDLTDVSIPNFGAPPFSAVDNTRLNDAGFRPGCDGGVLVGGFTNFQGSSAQLVKFQILNGRDCGP